MKVNIFNSYILKQFGLKNNSHLVGLLVSRYHSKIYTKKGDNGYSSTTLSGPFYKTRNVFESLGTNDELSCHIGKIRAQLALVRDWEVQKIIDFLIKIQCCLQDINSIISYIEDKEEIDEIFLKFKNKDKHFREFLKMIEEEIDFMDAELPKLQEFIIQGGSDSTCESHITRAVCRRAERALLRLEAYQMDEELYSLKILNRLSDYFFTLSRYIGVKNKDEVIKHKTII